MNEYSISLEITKWGFFFKKRETDTFIVTAQNANEAVELARSGLVPGIEGYREYWDGEEDLESYFKIRVLSVQKL